MPNFLYGEWRISNLAFSIGHNLGTEMKIGDMQCIY